ncbi:1,2-phenylacetyl-CoA epoxidase subunit PaaD [Streptomyces sp. NRRL S-1868]|uniref:1,2-phenylacetyl-CoA epoxidase subunit PaaD n=1 Tax=Streptomyces sp. NRRL S-1868 TaxID=1463892 RepID=UPI000689C24E|nr:1,2-phenylacetyl-CoA epoxidase subunit PaaD [Streptomyces sp. NRRL S-1868]
MVTARPAPQDAPGTRPPASGPTRLPALRELAGSVPDPELPVVTLAELGVLRSVSEPEPGRVEVELTPTYTGCPALETMAEDVERTLTAAGIQRVTVRTVFSPPWSTDDISEEGRRKLAEHGVAPPRPGTGRDGPVPVRLSPTRRADGLTEQIRCPHCGAAGTELLSRFSSTACTSLRRCLACREPFDHFKEV